MSIMGGQIYYFSGTGNSLFVAKQIAERTGAKLTSVPSILSKGKIETEADSIGLVFPVYYATNDCGLPNIIRRFISKMENFQQKYLFAVCTCGNMPGTTLENLATLIRQKGSVLSAGFIIKMSDKTVSKEKNEKALRKQKAKIEYICKYVSAGEKGVLETRNIWSKIVLAPMLYLAIKPLFKRRYRKLSGSTSLPFSELIPLADESFQVDTKCVGCGICAQVCPVDNIRLVNRKPVWQHHCETCLACYSWCPQEAISGEIVSYNTRHHHPTVKLTDMLAAKQ